MTEKLEDQLDKLHQEVLQQYTGMKLTDKKKLDLDVEQLLARKKLELSALNSLSALKNMSMMLEAKGAAPKPVFR